MGLSGKIALVTGGARRVGKAIVLELARSGCDVAIHCHESLDDADQTACQVVELDRQAVVIPADLNDPEKWAPVIDRVIAEYGQLDILVNNASLFLHDDSDTFDGFDPACWDRMLRTNLIAPMALSHHAAPHLRAGGSGNIINLCDAAVDRPWRNHLAYSSSKAGLACLTKALACSLAPEIRVNGVAPGIAVFPETYPQDLRDRLVRRVPLGRPGTPEGVALLVAFLIESGNYVTGQVISIDGGRNLI